MGTDLDGCIARGVEQFMLDELNKIYKPLYKKWEELPTYYFTEIYPTNRIELDCILLRCPYEDCTLIDDSQEALERLYQTHNIYIITRRLKHKNILERTKKWLKKHKVPYDFLILSGKKGRLVDGFDLDFFVEDSPHYAKEIAEYGRKVYILDQNYNKEAKHENIIRVSGWKDIIEEVENGL